MKITDRRTHDRRLGVRRADSPTKTAPDFDNVGVTRAVGSPVAEALSQQQPLEDPKAQLRSTLDSLSDNVAVLDTHGNIVMTNAAWQQFALNFSSRPKQVTPHSDVGINYLDMPSRCVNPDDESCQAVQGIRDVLSGRMDAFNLSYPCHTSQAQHWFTMTVTPLEWEGRRGALVTHTETTPRHRLHRH